MKQTWIRTALVLLVFGAVFLALVIGSCRLKSATWDEPRHLMEGYIACKLRDYRFGPEHPPFLRMWAALPLLATGGIKVPTDDPNWLNGNQDAFCRRFFFQDNDADSLLIRGRMMIALLGVLLGILVFCWAREWTGFWPAVVVLGLYCTEPNLVAHSGLVTTDLGATCFIFGASYFAWRVARNFNSQNVIGLIVFFTLAQVSKYSAVFLGLVLCVLLLVRALKATPWRLLFREPKLISSRTSRVLLTVLVAFGLLAASYVGFWSVYSFRHAPTAPELGEGRFQMSADASSHFPHLMRLMQWVDDHHLLPNACAQGFASMATTTQGRKGYLLGETGPGWWYYFPLAFLIKTPIALVALAGAGLTLYAARWKNAWLDAAFVLIPPLVYFAMATIGRLNIGLRHILMVYPFVLLLAGGAIAALLSLPATRLNRRWGNLIVSALCLAQLVEFAAVYPHCLAFFNVTVGGPRHGAEYLVDSNLDWGQDLKPLKRWMTQHQVDHINLSYFGFADPAYYGIEYTPLPGAQFFDVDRITYPRLPGYVAVSATNLRGAYLTGRFRNFYTPLWQQNPVAVLGYSIYVYRVEKPWW
jgi:hypothetical protein